ncbi:hypothetical protein MHBO_004135 [Bonamia ostreae]|uniref:Uncharacterized protein n=1 Tax=Bonamia ostreae TaxID=126728 RepID=A0ABV2ASH6_9EUKA
MAIKQTFLQYTLSNSNFTILLNFMSDGLPEIKQAGFVEPKSIIRPWLKFDWLKGKMRRSSLDEKRDIKAEMDKTKIILARLMVELDAQWPLELKEVENSYFYNNEKQNLIDFSRETFYLTLNDGKERKTICFKSESDHSDFIKKLKTKFCDNVKKVNGSLSSDYVENVYKEIE